MTITNDDLYLIEGILGGFWFVVFIKLAIKAADAADAIKKGKKK